MPKALVIFVLFIFSWVGADTIYLATGGIRAGVEVTQENFKVITFIAGDEKKSLQANLVKKVEHSNAPQEFIEGSSSLLNGQAEEAAYSFKEALKKVEDGSAPPWLEEYANFHLAQAYQKWADIDISEKDKYNLAISHYKKVLDKSKETRFFYHCHFGLAQSYIELKKYDDATKALDILKEKANNNKVSKWSFAATFWQGHAASAQKDYDNALNKYKDAFSFAKPNKSLKSQARQASFAVGNCYIDKKDFPSAISHFEKIKGDAGKNDWELKAGAENGLAASFLAQGQTIKARALAIRVFLHYYQAVEQRARALFIAGMCNEKRKDKESNAIKRAKQYYTILKAGYPDSEWTLKALRRLQKLR